jgi:hypothetical protein
VLAGVHNSLSTWLLLLSLLSLLLLLLLLLLCFVRPLRTGMCPSSSAGLTQSKSGSQQQAWP